MCGSKYAWPKAKLQSQYNTKVLILILFILTSLPETFLMLNMCNTYVIKDVNILVKMRQPSLSFFFNQPFQKYYVL